MDISLDDALKAIQQHITAKKNSDINGIVIVACGDFVSPSVFPFNNVKSLNTFNPYSLGTLPDSEYVINPDWSPGKYERCLFPSTVKETEKIVPFSSRYQLGDKFKVVDDSSGCFNDFYSPIEVGSILKISEVDHTDEQHPYEFSLEYGDKEDWSWGDDYEFQRLIEDGSIVYTSPEKSQTYDAVIIDGITYNLVARE